jgi:tRNA 2-thiouridine synthesizing protein A
MKLKPDQSLDLRGKECPFTILEIGKAFRTLTAGDLLEVISDRESVIADVEAWCKETGAELAGTDTDVGVKIYLRKC